jgi:hypothetical protein
MSYNNINAFLGIDKFGNPKYLINTLKVEYKNFAFSLVYAV